MNILTVENLCKNYPAFQLKNVSFQLEKGKITGFIGRNGAGKTTTLKSLFNFIHPDSGRVSFFDMEFAEHELEIKQRVGFVSGGIDFYPNKRLRTITAAARPFYPQWDDGEYRKYLGLFALDETKTPAQLSAGMKVKYSLALALSHHAELLILDEPTSGLDPVSRDELLEIFMDLCEKGVTILFSTHITSDLEKCADQIIYIKNGAVLAQSELRHFVSGYRIYDLTKEQLTPKLQARSLGTARSKYGYSVLLRADEPLGFDAPEQQATLEEIMVHLEK
ncbi:MAG: ABC transporter ATP-binding protein [Firmicutes bacterium]|nr:ABC transporter ATP-binding protein [Bacillota bacterium]